LVSRFRTRAEGPTELVLAGSVMETVRLLPGAGGVGTGVPEGESARGRLFLFSAAIFNQMRGQSREKRTLWLSF
jgi:hypothetical protein